MSDPALNAIIVSEAQLLRLQRYLREGETDIALALIEGLLDEGVRTKEDCPHCAGSGQYAVRRSFGRRVYPKQVRCPFCKGSGEKDGGS